MIKRICKFCGKNENEVSTLFGGPNVFICDECVTVAYEILIPRKDIPLPSEEQ